jgi:hypothetical protein
MVKLETLLKHIPGWDEVNNEDLSQDNRRPHQFRTDNLQNTSQNYCSLMHLFRLQKLHEMEIGVEILDIITHKISNFTEQLE